MFLERFALPALQNCRIPQLFVDKLLLTQSIIRCPWWCRKLPGYFAHTQQGARGRRQTPTQFAHPQTHFWYLNRIFLQKDLFYNHGVRESLMPPGQTIENSNFRRRAKSINTLRAVPRKQRNLSCPPTGVCRSRKTCMVRSCPNAAPDRCLDNDRTR